MKQLLIGVGVAAIAALSAGTVALATTTPAPKEVITVSPSAIDPGDDQALLAGTGCSDTGCHFKITETSGSNKPVQWSVEWFEDQSGSESDPDPPSFDPSGGTLHPGNSVTVTVHSLCDDLGDSAIVVSGRGQVTPGQTSGDITTAAAIAVFQCG
jgi:hypothetical protein